jgi:hypothetical protein
VLSLAQLPHLASDNVVLENIANLQSISILACPNLSDDFDFVYDWIDSKTTDDRYCSLVMDGVDWHLSNADKFMRLLALKTNGGTFSIKGKVRMDTIKIEQIYAIRDTLGESSFDPNAELYVDIPSVLQINAEDSVLEGNNLQFTTSIYPYLDGQYTWSLESGRSGCSIDQNGLLITEETALDTSDVVVKVKFVSIEGEVLTATKTISVVRRTYPQNILINGATDPRESAEYTWIHKTAGVNGEYSVVWSLEGGVSSYWRIASSDSHRCVLEKTGPMPSSVSGTIKVTIVREFDKGVASTGSLALSLPVVFPTDAIIIGNVNPLEAPHTYTWETKTTGVNGDYYAEWSLSGEVTSLVKIESQDDEKCVLKVINAASEVVGGELKLVLKKRYDGSTFVTSTMSLAAVMEGVVITSISNAPIQSILFKSGLVAHETYSLQEEVEKITLSQLYSDDNEQDSIFNNWAITHFEEFKYFTGITRIGSRLFYNCQNLEKINLPPITQISTYGFYNCKKLLTLELPSSLQSIDTKAFYGSGIKSIIIPDAVTSLGEYCFYNCSNLESIQLGSSLASIGQSAFSMCLNLKTIRCLRMQAPQVYSQTFGSRTSEYTGRNTYSAGINKLYVPLNAAGYETSYWLDPLQNSTKSGFSIYGKIIIDANNSSAIFSVTYTSVNGDIKTQNLNAGTSYLNDIQYGTNVTIRVVSGGIPEEGVEKTFVYNDANITHTFTFAREGSWITIDQNIIDADTMISGDINGEHIQAIRNNSHRYLGKLTALGQMTICQLADSNSSYYAKGESAVLSGGEGDVFVKLPRFWYAANEKETNVWEIGFYYGTSAPKDSYWIEWDGNDLLGAFAQGKRNDKKLYSISGQSLTTASTSLLSLSDSLTYASNRGSGFKLMPMKWYNIMSLLYYAQYGSTNFNKKFSNSLSSEYSTGTSISNGMYDVSLNEANNFWGVEGLVYPLINNFIGNALVDYVSPNHVWKITEDDRTIRNVTGSSSASGYIMKMVIGTSLDFIPKEIDVIGDGSSTTGFCTVFARAASSSRVVSIALGAQITANKPNNNSYAHCRLAFRGTIIEESDPAVFKSLTAIG